MTPKGIQNAHYQWKNENGWADSQEHLPTLLFSLLIVSACNVKIMKSQPLLIVHKVRQNHLFKYPSHEKVEKQHYFDFPWYYEGPMVLTFLKHLVLKVGPILAVLDLDHIEIKHWFYQHNDQKHESNHVRPSRHVSDHIVAVSDSHDTYDVEDQNSCRQGKVLLEARLVIVNITFCTVSHFLNSIYSLITH